MGIFDSLHIGYSGLSSAQTGINTTSHNISNANTPGYSKEVVKNRVNYPIHKIPGDVGAGTAVRSIQRVHDEFVYTRLKSSSSNLEYASYMEKSLKEITTYAPDLDDLGIAKDLKDFFANWSKLAQNPNDDSQKVALTRATISLTKNINSLSDKYKDLRNRINDEVKQSVVEVNKIAKEIANLNKNINKVESANSVNANANDLRDQRDLLELKLAKMLNIEVSKSEKNSEFGKKSHKTDMGVSYNINVGGFNLVDGGTYHPLRSDNSVNNTELNSIYYVDQNRDKVDVTPYIKGGKIGAMIALRGDRLDPKTGRAENSKIQDYLDDLDSFSKTLIDSVNSVYASSSQDQIVSDDMSSVGKSGRIFNLGRINQGSFEIKVYDGDGIEVASKFIQIDENTVVDKNIQGYSDSNSIVHQINQNSDDNGDNDATNDVDDYFKAEYIESRGKLRIVPKEDKGYSIAIVDHGTNFAGRVGINKFFDGDKSSNIALREDFKQTPSKISAHKALVDGNSDLANDMVELQYKKVTFVKNSGQKTEQTIEDFYRYSSSKIASDAHQSTINKDSADLLNKTVTNESKSVSGVDMDEELVNLMKYQTAYQANAKVITAVDRMLDTLLSIR